MMPFIWIWPCAQGPPSRRSTKPCAKQPDAPASNYGMASKVAPMPRSGIRGDRWHDHSRIPLHDIKATLAVVQPADDVAGLIEQPGLAPSRGRILMPVHAVFPYGWARAPPLQSPSSSRPFEPCRRPRRDIIRRRRRPPQLPTTRRISSAKSSAIPLLSD